MVGQPGLLTTATGWHGQTGTADATGLPRAAPAQPLQAGAGARRAGCAIAAAALLLVALVRWQPAWALVVKALLDPLFHSTSTGAAQACLALAALGGLCLALGRCPPLPAARWLAGGLLAAVALGNAANLAAHLALLQQQGLPWSLAVYHWSGDTNTYSYLLHTHAGKAALHALFSGWGAALVQGFDIGAGLAAQLPPAWGLLCAAALVVGLLAWAVLLPAVVALAPPGAAWPLGLLYSYCALNAAKAIADGGPLTYRFAPVLAVLLWMLPGLLRLGPAWLRAAAATGLLALAGSGWLSWRLAGPQAGEALGGLATTLAVIGLLAAWAWLICRTTTWLAGGRRLRAAVATVATACGLGLLASLGLALLGGPAALLLPLPDGMQATSCQAGSHCQRFAVAGQRAFDVYRRLGDDPLKPRHTLLALQGDDGDSQLLLAIGPLHTGPADGLAGNPVQVAPVQALPHAAGVLVSARTTHWPRIFLAAPGPFSAANYHVFLHLTAARLRAQGLQVFSMAPLRHQQDADALGLALPPTGAP